MEDMEVDTEIPTSTTTKAIPQEPIPHVELAEKVDSMMTMEQTRNRKEWVTWSTLRLRVTHKDLLPPWR